jgi:hypothetical protein
LSSDTENNLKSLLVIGNILGIVGALAVIIGMFLEFDVIAAGEVDVFGLLIVTICAGIFIICIVSLIGSIPTIGFTAIDERPSIISLAILILTPTILFSSHATPIYYLLTLGNNLLDQWALGTQPLGFGFFLTFIGVAVLIGAFLVLAIMFYLRNRFVEMDTSQEVGQFVRALRIITGTLILLAGVGIILGIIFPMYESAPNGLLMSDTSNHIDLQALLFIVLMVGVIVIALLVILSNIGVIDMTTNEIPLLIFLAIPLVLPGYTPIVTFTIWTSPIFSILMFVKAIFTSPLDRSFTAFGWIGTISSMILVLTAIMTVMSYFFSQSVAPSGGPAISSRRAKRRLGGKKKKGKFPTSPPSASAGEGSSSGLVSQLTSDSGPPTGPPSASPGTQPTVSSSPPSPPSFQASPPSSSQESSDTPTCPFCGKPLRFIQEYQRWYCDSCSQYV